MKAIALAFALLLLAAANALADTAIKPLTKGGYVVIGRVVSGTLIANFGLNIGDVVIVSDDAKTMTIPKSGRKFPIGANEPGLIKIEDKIAECQAVVEADAKELDAMKGTVAKDEAELKDTIAKMEALIASVPNNTIYYNTGSGGYYVSSQASMTNEQSQLFYDLNKRPDSLRKEIKQTKKKLPDAENTLDHDRKTLASYEAMLADYRKSNPLPPEPESPDKALKDRLAKLKNLFNDGLLTKDQYDKSVKEALDAAPGLKAAPMTASSSK